MTYVGGQLGDRLQRQLTRAYRQWRHPSSGRRQTTASCSGGHPQAAAVSAADTNRPDTGQPSGHPVRGSGSRSGQRTPPQRPQLSEYRAAGRDVRDGLRPADAGLRRTRSRRLTTTAVANAVRTPRGLRILCWSAEPGRRRPADIDGPDGADSGEASGHRQPVGTDTRDCGSTARTLRQRSHWTAGNGTARRSPAPDTACPTRTRSRCAQRRDPWRTDAWGTSKAGPVGTKRGSTWR